MDHRDRSVRGRRLSPSYELYRRVARWGTTAGLVSPNVVDTGAEVAVLVTARTSVDALDGAGDGPLYVSRLIDTTKRITSLLGNELTRFGARYLEEAGKTVSEVATRVHDFWKVQDRDILSVIQAS